MIMSSNNCASSSETENILVGLMSDLIIAKSLTLSLAKTLTPFSSPLKNYALERGLRAKGPRRVALHVGVPTTPANARRAEGRLQGKAV